MAGKRHSKGDMTHIQGMHDSSTALGADCSMGNVAWPLYSESCREASLPMNQSHDALRGHLRTALMHAHNVSSTYDSSGPYVMDTFPKDVVYQHGGKTYQRTYSVNHTKTPPSVNLGDPTEVHRAYVPVSDKAKESLGYLYTPSDVIITSDDVIEETVLFGEAALTALSEAAGAVANFPVKLISPGWGTSGYYSADMLKRDGPNVFKKDLHMYLNHPSKTEEVNRPERDVKDLASVLAEDAKWHDNGWDGPGLYSMAKPFASHYGDLKEKGKYIGTSIRAKATKISAGEAEGKSGRIVEGLERAFSVDYVTLPGRGGKMLLEGERPSEPQVEIKENNGMAMTEQEQTALREAQAARDTAVTAAATAVAESNRLRAEANQAIATAAYIEAFRAKGIELTVEAAKVMATNPPLTEKGAVDMDAIKKVAEGVKAAGKKPAAGVRNLGEGVNDGAEEADKTVLADYEKSLRESGLSEAAAKIAVAGRL